MQNDDDCCTKQYKRLKNKKKLVCLAVPVRSTVDGKYSVQIVVKEVE